MRLLGKSLSGIVLTYLLLLPVIAQAAISDQNYDIIPGYFDSDSYLDILAISKDQSNAHLLYLGYGEGQYILAGSSAWQDGLFGIPWTNSGQKVIPGYFNQDNLTDLFFQGNGSASSSGVVTSTFNSQLNLSISNQWTNGHLGLNWDLGSSNIVPGNFVYQSGLSTDFILQNRLSSGNHALVTTGSQPLDTLYSSFGDIASGWSTNYPGLTWNAWSSKVYSGDFNGDGYSDIFIQAKRGLVLIPAGDGPIIPIQTNPKPTNAILINDQNGHFTVLQTWPADYLGQNWYAEDALPVIGDLNGDGRDDILLQAKYSSASSAVLLSDISGKFNSVDQTLSDGTSGVNWSQQNSTIKVVPNYANGTGKISLMVIGHNGTMQQVSLNSSGQVASVAAQSLYGDSSNTGMSHMTGTTVFGKLPGSFNVNSNGSTSYSVPITVPPGLGGMQPKLAINYSSGSGNGMLGVGWSLSGLTAISRCPRNYAQDREVSGINLDNNDRICLDGQRLVKVYGTYGIDGARYRTESDTYSLIIQHYDLGDARSWFEVKTKAGQTFQYGATDDSRFNIQTSPPISWGVNKITDAAGNYLTVSYQEDTTQGSQYPDTIRYTMNGNYDTHKWVKFEYEERPDIQTGYIKGYSYVHRLRLGEINTYYNAGSVLNTDFIRNYQIVYDANEVTNQSLISYIRECAGDGSCLPATTFDWQGTKLANYQWSTAPVQTGVCFNTSVTVVKSGTSSGNAIGCADWQRNLIQYPDVNGDGRSDICSLKDGEGAVYCSLATDTGFTPWTLAASFCSGDQGCLESVHYADVNGDGMADLIYRPSNETGIVIQTSNGSDFTKVFTTQTSSGTQTFGRGETVTTGLMKESAFADPNIYYVDRKFYTPDLNADGLADICTVLPDGMHCYLNTGTGFTEKQAFYVARCSYGVSGYNACSLGQLQFADLNQDGKPDLVARDYNGIFYAYSTGAGFSTAVSTAICANGSGSYGVCNDSDNFDTIQLADVTGDGTLDLCFRSDAGIRCIPGNGQGFDTQNVISTTICRNGGDNLLGNCNDADNFQTIKFADVNQDGKADLIYRSDGGMRAWLSTGDGFAPYKQSIWNSNIMANGTGYDTDNIYTSNFGDFNGDGLLDYAFRDDSGVRVYFNEAKKTNLLTGISDGFGNNTTITYAPLTDSSVYTPGICAYPELCIKGGPIYVMQEYTASNGVGGVGRYGYTYSDMRLHLLGRGFLGFSDFTKRDYQSHINTVVTSDRAGRGSVTNPSIDKSFANGFYPTLGMPLQKTVTYDDGTTSELLESDTYQNDYFTTEGAAYFPYFVTSTTDKYDFDTGQNITTETVSNTFDTVTDPGSHLAGDITDINTTTVDHVNNLTFSKVTHSTYDNNFSPAVWNIGRVTNTKVTHTGYGDTQVRESSFHYYTATTLATDPQGDSYWQFAGMLAYTEEEPSALNGADNIKPDYLKTSYYYDQFGEKQKVEVDGYTGIPLTMQSRFSKSRYDLTTVGQHNLVVDTYNQLGHHETKVIDTTNGVTLSQTGPNGLSTYWDYDGFGRIQQERRADGTNTTTTQGFCKGQCGPVANVTPTYWTTVQASGSAPVTKFYDQLGRQLRASTTDVSRRNIYQDTVYDANGRVQQHSLRYFAGETPLWTHVYFDAIGRVQREEAPSGTTTTNSYAALTTTTTVTRRSNLNPGDAVLAGESDYEDRVTVKAYYADGKVHLITDPALGQTEYFYDAVGNLIETDAPNQTPGDHSTGDFIKTVIRYDHKGRKIGMDDPDMGTWSYTYDSFGKLLKQVDAKGQSVVMVYDKLDRMVLRIEPEGISRWVYDNNLAGTATGAHIGKLMLMAGPIPLSDAQYNANIASPPDPASITLNGSEPYSRSYVYDNLGRPISVSTTMDGGSNPQTFQVDRNYDAYSRVHQVIYPTNVANTRFIVEYHYDDTTGTLLDVHDPVSGIVYWALGNNGNTSDALSAIGKVQQETYGNGIVTDRYYDRATGLIQSISTSDTTLQDDEYVFDSLGNLQKRQDHTHIVNNVAYNEVFHYDKLNRLTHTWLNGADSQAFTYTASGNINSKSTWYPAAPMEEEYYHYDGSTHGGPHAVAFTSSDQAGTSVLNTYQYDANGNLYTGAGRGMSYTSFNLPWNIARGSALDTFYYAADHTRYKQADLSKTIYYLRPEANVGAHFEREIENGVTTDIHYIYAGGGLVATHHVRLNADNTTTTFDQYYHRDHLGSPEVITDSNGTVKERLSYAAFGERRPSDWTTPNATTLITASLTHYGFTGHEHMDDVGLIHMNGRVYDPKLGRFLSADPNIQAPHSSQSFNRYSYVVNNPLSLTDPTGFSFLGDFAGGFQLLGNSAENFLDHYVMPYVPTAITLAAAYVTGQYYGPAVGGAVGGATSAAINGGNIISGALTGALTGYLYDKIGVARVKGDLDSLGAMMAHGVVGGLSSGLQGNRVDSGFLAGFAGTGMGIYGKNIPGPELIKVAIAGGIVSRLGGGKFETGAMTAAMGYLFNELNHLVMSCHTPQGENTNPFDQSKLGGKSLWEMRAEAHQPPKTIGWPGVLFPTLVAPLSRYPGEHMLLGNVWDVSLGVADVMVGTDAIITASPLVGELSNAGLFLSRQSYTNYLYYSGQATEALSIASDMAYSGYLTMTNEVGLTAPIWYPASVEVIEGMIGQSGPPNSLEAAGGYIAGRIWDWTNSQ